ncbi:MAG TPA: SDR family oxidoreductase [Candidatus Paceibacterota bacterium]|nr:SDR family oxidoreductase [Verrucomicrobiota bacterium]HSA11133.1 SDR family oxidoreductase [Candidatus Paceibacterota bacterium]
MTAYDIVQEELKTALKVWLVTGVAGFIGSNLLEALLKLDQRVIGLDNFSTGKRRNLEEVKEAVSQAQWSRLRIREGDIGDLALCREACAGVDFVLHEAALGSVPLSMTDPLGAHESNVTGFLNMLLAARDAGVKRFVYASSSAVYGNERGLPATEGSEGRPLSPYAATKSINEVYAQAFAQAYGLGCIGLRYFNVFGPRQDPEGAYAAVIPHWIAALLKRQPVHINGDGETSRDFCYVANVVQANLLAATTRKAGALDEVYNVALGQRTTLNELFRLLESALRARDASVPEQKPIYRDFRPGDVRHSVADIGKARRLLGYAPTHSIQAGLDLAMDWYRRNVG